MTNPSPGGSGPPIILNKAAAAAAPRKPKNPLAVVWREMAALASDIGGLWSAVRSLEARPIARDGRDGAPGPAGVGVRSAIIDRDGDLILSLTDGETLNVGPVVGKDGEPGQSIKGERGDDGASVEAARLTDAGHLIVTYAGVEHDLGMVRGKPGPQGERGESVKGDPGRDGADGVGVAGAEVRDGDLVLSLTDGREIVAGHVVGREGPEGAPGKQGESIKGDPGPEGPPGTGVSSATLSADGDLVLCLTDGRAVTVGRVRGERGSKGDDGQSIKGDPGVGISDALVADDGVLVFALTDGRTLRAGHVVGAPGEPGKDASPDVITHAVDAAFARLRSDVERHLASLRPEIDISVVDDRVRALATSTAIISDAEFGERVSSAIGRRVEIGDNGRAGQRGLGAGPALTTNREGTATNG